MTSYVAVCGAGTATEEEAATAEEVGRLLAERGAVVVCGGLTGVMEAAARGASTAGGISVGLLPGQDRTGASEHLTVAIPLGMGEARNALVVRAADAVIAVGGEWGTLSEIALAMKMGTPVVGLGTWDLLKDGEPVPGVIPAETPSQAVESALAEARGSS
ncbi:MAG: TIGR00725 family protein [Actinomycetota bacterium]|nr:TIGR00725 family protein [Actinomycetota bacterium]